MNLYSYKALEEYEQFEMLFEKGVLLMDRSDNKYSYVLYQVDSFYVEIKHELCNDAINSLRSFSSPDLLEPYLDIMEIDFTKILF
jgi:hypothetical protein